MAVAIGPAQQCCIRQPWQPHRLSYAAGSPSKLVRAFGNLQEQVENARNSAFGCKQCTNNLLADFRCCNIKVDPPDHSSWRLEAASCGRHQGQGFRYVLANREATVRQEWSQAMAANCVCRCTRIMLPIRRSFSGARPTLDRLADSTGRCVQPT